MRSGLDLNIFASAADLADAAADFMVTRVRAALAGRGKALLLLSGGSTPLPVYERLAAAALDWTKIAALLVDERWVASDHPSSNERAVRAAFEEKGAALDLMGLKTADATPFDAVDALNRRVAARPWPADVAVLGMGADGHTASWFPHAEGLGSALQGPARVAAVRARKSPTTGDLTERVTLTAPTIREAGAQLLLITGAEKREVYERARADGLVAAAPVRALLAPPAAALYVAWAP